MPIEEKCPKCGYVLRRYRNPMPTVDIIIEIPDQGLVLIERANPPHGWALPGGFVDYGESLEDAARREAREETGLMVDLLGQFHTYSDPKRDPRQHNLSTVFVARATALPRPRTTPGVWEFLRPRHLPRELAFDHGQILADYLKVRPQWLTKLKKTS